MQKKMKLLRAYVADNWKIGLLVTAIIGGFSALLLYKLGSLTGGLSDAEFKSQQLIAQDGLGLSTVLRDALFLPYNLFLYILQYTPFTGPSGIRVTGVLFGLLGLLGMFYIFRSWYTTRVALLGTGLFATSSWFLHTARYADEAVSYLLIPLLVAAIIALQTKARSKVAMTAAVIFGTAMLYLPGVLLFIVPALIIKRRVIIAALKLQPLWYTITLSAVAVLTLVPLVVTLIKPLPGSTALQNILTLLGLPGNHMPSLQAIATNLKDGILGVFAYNNAGPIYVPGHLPWFDICTTVLVLIGIVQFARYWRLDRSKLIAITGLLSVVLIALGGVVNNVILLPFAFLFAIEGLKWLLETWLNIFPRNPFARSFAIGMMCLLTLSIASYHINKYFLAWGRSPETRQVFNKHP